MLALLGPLIGIFGSLLPSLLRLFERKQEIKFELERTKLQLENAVTIESLKADTAEGQSVRNHDIAVDGGSFFNALRASIRPVITYLFFFLFCAVKISAAYVMLDSGVPVPEMLKAVWDAETMALFGTIMTFWFGSRTMEKHYDRIVTPTTIVTVANKVERKNNPLAVSKEK